MKLLWWLLALFGIRPWRCKHRKVMVPSGAIINVQQEQ